jgi:hypothetical protein
MPTQYNPKNKLKVILFLTQKPMSLLSPGQIPNQVFKGQQTLINNIVKSLLKKGIVTDLARIPHSLVLSSPYMANTINSALKPLETLY